MVVADRAVVTVPDRDLSREQVDLIKRTVAKDATDLELELFLNQAKRLGLDPLVRQIHFVKRGSTGTIQVAIDGYRLIAERTGSYAGNDDPIYKGTTDDGKHPAQATVTVWKLVQGQRCPFSATARWSEYRPEGNQGFMWNKMPFLMLGKVAEALALRKAFPAELAGTYVDEEMHQADDEPTPEPARPTYRKVLPQSVMQPAQESQPSTKSPTVASADATARQIKALRERWDRLWATAQELHVADAPTIPGNADATLIKERCDVLAGMIEEARAQAQKPPEF